MRKSLRSIFRKKGRAALTIFGIAIFAFTVCSRVITLRDGKVVSG